MIGREPTTWSARLGHEPNGLAKTVRDYDRLAKHIEAALGWIAITLLTRRITCSPTQP